MTTMTRSNSNDTSSGRSDNGEEEGLVHPGTTATEATATATTTTTTVTRTTHGRQPIDASTFRIDHDPHDGHKQPERRRAGGGEESYHSSEPQGGGKSSSSHDNPLVRKKGPDGASTVGSVTTRPGAVLIGGNRNALIGEEGHHEDEGRPIVDNNDNVLSHHHLPIVAQLVPDDDENVNSNNSNVNNNTDDDDVEARIKEEVEERIRQRDENIIVAEEAKAVPTHVGGWTTGRQGIVVMFLLFLLVLGGGVGGLLYGLLKNDDQNRKQVSNGSDEASPGGMTEDLVILPLDPLVEELKFWIAPTEDDLLLFNDPTSPQSQTLAWLQDDPITQTPGRSTRTVLERYVVVVLHYTTSGPSWNMNYMSTTTDVCTWNNGVVSEKNQTNPYYLNGIHCATDKSGDSDSIERLILGDNKLRGSLPWELVLLTNLKYIIFSSNGLTGSIPTRINELTRLEAFLASYTGLSGSLPQTFSPSITFIGLDDCWFTGQIPDSWGKTMPALQNVFLGGNSLTGTLPSTLEQLTDLTILNVRDNVLTGTVPSGLGQLSRLEVLLVSLNSLLGPMDDGLCLLTSLSQLEADCEEIDCPCCTTCCFSDNQCGQVSV